MPLRDLVQGPAQGRAPRPAPQAADDADSVGAAAGSGLPSRTWRVQNRGLTSESLRGTGPARQAGPTCDAADEKSQRDASSRDSGVWLRMQRRNRELPRVVRCIPGAVDHSCDWQKNPESLPGNTYALALSWNGTQIVGANSEPFLLVPIRSCPSHVRYRRWSMIDGRFSDEAFELCGLDTKEARELADKLEQEIQNEMHEVVWAAFQTIVQSAKFNGSPAQTVRRTNSGRHIISG